jgi:hypothetical protein
MRFNLRARVAEAESCEAAKGRDVDDKGVHIGIALLMALPRDTWNQQMWRI